jgi:hypothetical protein
MQQIFNSLLLVVSLFPQCAQAWCDTPDTGRSKNFFVAIYIVSECNPNDTFPNGTEVIEFTPLKKDGESSGESHTFRKFDECETLEDVSGFSCAKSGHTPLAGATYVTTKDMKDGCDETGKKLVDRLTCVKGCKNDRAPKYIVSSPWEC